MLEWTAKTPGAEAYDGGAPREMIRWEHPFANHNGGHLSFNPLATPTSPDFGLLYLGFADGGSGGDPLGLAQNRGLRSARFCGSIRSAETAPTASTAFRPATRSSGPGNAGTLGEIYVLRRAQSPALRVGLEDRQDVRR